MKIQDFFRDIPNFPKEGILFKDITPLLLNYEATKLCLDTLASTVLNKKIDIFLNLMFNKLNFIV